MSPDDRLARWYRRLLLAYPRRYRRGRGQEIMSTLLDAAEPGQRRPQWRDAANLVLRGLMRRFEIPRGPGYAVTAATFALFCAFAASAGAAWAAGQRPERVPSAPSALAVARLATSTGPLGVEVAPRESNWPDTVGFDNPDRPPPGYPAERASIRAAAPADESGPAWSVAQARDRLVAQGWRVGDVTTVDSIHLVWAAHDDLVVRVSSMEADALVHVDVFYRTPSWIALVVTAGGAAGLAGGWIVAGAALRAFRRHGLRGRAAMIVLGAPGLLAATVATIYILLALVVEFVSGAGPTVAWRVLVVATPATEPFIGMAVLALVGAAAVAIFAPRVLAAEGRAGPAAVGRIGPAGVWRVGAGAAATVHIAFAVASLAVVVAYLVLAWHTGERPLTAAHDPKDLVPFGSSGHNPFIWAFETLVLVYLAGALLSPLLLVVSVPLLLVGRVLRPPGARRVGMVLLLAVLTSVVPLLLLVSPLGHEAGTWLMD
jgi:hypothetical protein